MFFGIVPGAHDKLGAAIAQVHQSTDKILNQATNQGALSEAEAKRLLKACGFVVPLGGLAQSAAEARSLASNLGCPVVLKASSPALLHKTEAGVIRLGLKRPDEVEE